MISQCINPSLNETIWYNDKPDNKITILYAPGIFSMGRFAHKVEKINDNMLARNIDVNIANFLYRSHHSNMMTCFENDPKDLEEAVKSLEEFGIPRKNIGVSGLCYGSLVLTQYLNQGGEIGFAIFFEPYLGLNSLTRIIEKGIRDLKSTIKTLFESIGVTGIICGHRYNGEYGFFDPVSLMQILLSDIKLSNSEIPLLGLHTKFHSFFKENHIENFLSESGCKNYVLWSRKGSKFFYKDAQMEIYNVLASFIKDRCIAIQQQNA